MGNPTMCIGENKGADQLRSNCEADQRFSFRYTDSTIPLLSKSMFVFSCTGSYAFCTGSYAFLKARMLSLCSNMHYSHCFG